MVSAVSTWDVGASGVDHVIAMGAWHLPGPAVAARELGTAARADGAHCGGTNVGAVLVPGVAVLFAPRLSHFPCRIGRGTAVWVHNPLRGVSLRCGEGNSR